MRRESEFSATKIYISIVRASSFTNPRASLGKLRHEHAIGKPSRFNSSGLLGKIRMRFDF